MLRLAHKFLPQIKAVTGVDESGGEARTYALDEDYILKVQRPHRLRPRTSLEKEVVFLNQLASDPLIRVPGVLGYSREEDIEYTVMTRMPGKAFRCLNPAPGGKEREAVLFSLGQTLRRIHHLPQQPFEISGLFPGDKSFEEFKQRLEELFEEAVTRLQTQPAAWDLPYSPGEMADEALARLPQSYDRVTLHSNPGPEHLFIKAVDGRSSNINRWTFSGLIDFGDAYISHPALDLRRWQLPQDRQAILEGYRWGGDISDNFLSTWRVVNMLSDLSILAGNPEPGLREAVHLDLRTMLSEREQGLR